MLSYDKWLSHSTGAIEKNHACLGYIEDYTIQLCGDCNKLLNHYINLYSPISLMQSKAAFFLLRGSTELQ